MKHRLKPAAIMLGVIGFATFAGAALATPDSHTRVIAATCYNCHGSGGKSAGAIPSLAGLEKGYFIKQMQDFKSGARPATVMQKHAKGYTDAEIEKMAEFFAAAKK